MPTPFRHIKDVAREVVHRTMAVPAHYYLAGSSEPASLNVRRTMKTTLTGEMKGTNFNYAERAEEATYLIFWRAELAQPSRNAAVLLATGDAYFIDHVDAPDGLTISARVVVARPDQITGLLFPGQEPPEEEEGP